MKKWLLSASVVAAFIVACGVDSQGVGPASSKDPTSVAPDASSSGDDDDASAPIKHPDAGKHDSAPPGDDDDGDDSGPPPPGGCTVLPAVTFHPEDASIQTLSDGTELHELRTTFAGSGSLTLYLYRGAPGGFTTGTTNLACAPSTPCLNGFMYLSGGDFLPDQGSVTVSTLLSPTSNEMTGTLTGFRFRATTEVAVDGGFTDEIDPAGSCYTLPDITFDTTTPVGTPCLSEEQCGLTKVCSIATKTCVESQCTPGVTPSTCASTEICFNRPEGGAGYCVTQCGFYAPCPGSLVCDSGICKNAGSAALGATCVEGADVESGCVPGGYCKGTYDPAKFTTSYACVPTCNPLATDPGCGTTQRCVSTHCDTPLPFVSTAGIDETCTVPPFPGGGVGTSAPCADDGKAYRGVCRQESAFPGPSVFMCRRSCDPKGPACPTAGQTCQFDIFGGGSGTNYTCH